MGVSDNFQQQTIGTVWTFDPNDASGGAATPTAAIVDGELIFTIPDSSDYNLFHTPTINCPWVWQAQADEDFEIILKLASDPQPWLYTGHGLVIASPDEAQHIRFDRYYGGTQRIFVSTCTGSTSVSKANSNNDDTHLRIVRSGSTWTLYTGKGGAFTQRVSFSFPMVVGKIGIFNSSSSSSPGTVAHFDWLEHVTDDPRGWTGAEDDTAVNDPPAAPTGLQVAIL